MRFQSRKKVLVDQSCLTLFNSVVCPWNSVGKNTGVGCHSLLPGIFPVQGLNPNPGIEPRSPALQADSLPSALTGKPMIFQDNINCTIMINKGFQA